MAKFYGAVGYGHSVEVEPGVFEDQIVEHDYYGDVIRNTRRYDSGEHLNDNLNVNNLISIVADAYACDHFFAMKYVKWQEVRWKITNVEVQRPRLILTIGGVYNGPVAESLEPSEEVRGDLGQ